MLALAAAAVGTTPPISVSYSTIVDLHISKIMPVFLSDDLNSEWSPTLESHRIVYTREHGPLAHQQYRLPWPLAPRDVLLACERKGSQRDATLYSECHSVEHDAAPVRDDVVRIELSRTAWKIEALPDERTRLSLSLEMPGSVAVGVPKYVVRYCQRSSLRDSVTNLIAAVKRLDLPAHDDYVRWRRSRAAIAEAVRRAPPVAGASATTLLSWASEHAAAPVAALLAALAGLLVLHAFVFALLARLWRGRLSRGSSALSIAYSRVVRHRRGDRSAGRPASPTTVVSALAGAGSEVDGKRKAA